MTDEERAIEKMTNTCFHGYMLDANKEIKTLWISQYPINYSVQPLFSLRI
jgi:hypothetical protein